MKYVGEWVRESDELWFPYFNLSSGLSGFQRNGDAVLVFRVLYPIANVASLSCLARFMCLLPLFLGKLQYSVQPNSVFTMRC
jgi:hypothetical protein